MKNGDLPAMPAHQVWQDCGIDGNSGPHYVETVQQGLTKREMFAMAAMQGFCSNPMVSYKSLAEYAVETADSLLAELEKTK
jgi:hypothetical protein